MLEAVADKLELQVTDDEIRDELRAGRRGRGGDRASSSPRAAPTACATTSACRRRSIAIAAEVKPIAPELHEARESIWTPGQEQPAEPAKLWTPGSKET